MSRYLARISIGLWLSAIQMAQSAAVPEEVPPEAQWQAESIALDDNELRAITLQLLEGNPLLASSPGIKFASARRGFRIRSPDGIAGTSEFVDVIFYPHAESGGIKYAFQAQCQRQDRSELWECGNANLRRYVQLDSQDFELRVVSNIGIEVIHALVQATRAIARASASVGAPFPQAAILVGAEGGGYLVSWGNDQGHQTVSVQAHLKMDGNPAVPEDWQTEIFQPEE